MINDFVNVGLGFLEGFALIISPCILPILPIVLAGSVAGSKKRPIGVTLGFIVTFALFAFFSRQFIQYFHINLDHLRLVAYILLIALGIMMLSTYLTDQFNILAQRLITNKIQTVGRDHSKEGFFGGFLFGSLIGLIWTPCGGPILAAVIVQSVIQTSSWMSFLTLFAFSLGAALPMLLIAMYGQLMLNKFSFFKSNSLVFRKILGIVVIVSVGYLIYSEQVGSAPVSVSFSQTNMKATHLEDGLSKPYPVPAIEGIDQWINSKPIQLANLKGKVVLIDFWAYSCINCVRTFPYLRHYYDAYHDKGLQIIGVHAPEFDFEHKYDNVKQAVIRYALPYPVALDNKFTTWRNFHNQYWPAQYLVDREGHVVYTHFGEGNEDVTENNIRYLLGIDSSVKKKTVESSSLGMSDQTPETYLGYLRADKANRPIHFVTDKVFEYSFPAELASDAWGLEGGWLVKGDKIIAMKPHAKVKIHFNARYVYVVMGNKNSPVTVQVRLNGDKVNLNHEIKAGQLIVDKQTLYPLVELPKPSEGTLVIEATEPGLEVYTFTFGN